MWRITGVILVALGVLGTAASPVLAAGEAGHVLIVAIQTGSSTSAGEEYIALANISGQLVNLNGARLEYFSATPKNFTTPSRTIPLTGSVATGQLYELASTNYMNGQVDQAFTSTLAAAGGHLRLMGLTDEWDMLGWGTATGARGKPAVAPLAGQRLERRGNGSYQNTMDNSQDFAVPGELGAAPATDASGLRLTELLPDPLAPALDADAEFIELQNTGSNTIQLGGLKLVVGNTSLKSFTLPPAPLEPGAYIAYPAAQTKLALSNAGGRVQLQDVLGQGLDEVAYPKAAGGLAWAFDNQAWRWTASPTPGTSNQFKEAPARAVPVAKTVVKKTADKGAKKTVKKGAKKRAPQTSVKAAHTDQPGVVGSTTTTTKPPVHNAVIAGVGGLAVLYGAYEYRHDAINLYRKLRGNRGSG